MKKSVIFTVFLPLLFSGMANAADTNVVTEDGQLVIKATVEGSSCHFSSDGGNSATIDMGVISTSDVYKLGIGAVDTTKWNNEGDVLEIVCPDGVKLNQITFDPTLFSDTHSGLLQDDSGDTTGVGFAVDFHNTDSASVQITQKNQIVDVSSLTGTASGDGGVVYSLKFDARWARLAQVVKAGDVKSTIKFTVETD
ncbi:fimbrial protein [Citrobacter sp. RHB25-C09]|uniref:fimbrial protein n=1 Tax=Citrobacter sp. RHB25-C09 TaxID=2742624 RepID=UPI0015EFCA5E|nr:fimbrial protein [Citrobacter sp. RHB25-C09]QMI05722.1 hypothetical protein HVY19_12980 [Citrobacter sp. RHB25-C09]